MEYFSDSCGRILGFCTKIEWLIVVADDPRSRLTVVP